MAQAALEHPVDTWTFADLGGLPESGWRYEIIDGGLLMSPAPGRRHEVVSANLLVAMTAALGPQWQMIGPQNLDLSPTYLIPDLVVISAEAARFDATLTRPDELALVVEVVSPGSHVHDRVTKPALYAAAGIPAYWRIETEGPVSLSAYALEADATAYTELGTWAEGENAHLRAPFDLTIAIDDLVP